MIIYPARSITGRSYQEVTNYYEEIKKTLEGWGYKVIHPMTGKSHLRTETILKSGGYTNPTTTNHAIFERDKWMVSAADIIYANMCDMENASIGMCMELAWACLLGKHTIIATEEKSIHRHAFVMEAADIIFETHEEAMEYLRILGGY